MKDVEYVFTEGMTEGELEQLLRRSDHGVLALADGNDAYAVPLDYYFDGTRVLLRISEEPDSTKVKFARTTETATFVVYGVLDTGGSWSIVVRGTVRRLSSDEREQFTDSVINERFTPFRLFDETIPDVDIVIYELVPTEITGRKTVT